MNNEKRLRCMFDDAMKLRNAGDLIGARRLLESLVERLAADDRSLLSHAHSQLGHICQRLAHHCEREAHFRAAVAATPDYDLPSLGLFEALYDQGRRTEAFQEMARLMRLSYSRDYAEIVSVIDSDKLTEAQRKLVAEVRRAVARRRRN
jgi:hypothetical protein